MTEYISKEAVLQKFLERGSGYIDMLTMKTMIDEIPATDVQPVKRGRWIDCTFYDPYEKSWEQNYEFKCGNCGHMIYSKPNDDNLFCGHCGAKMDLKDSEQND